MKLRPALAVAAVAAGLGSAATCANAQATNDWQFQAIIYGYFPDIGGSTTFGTGPGSGINVDSSTLISDLRFAFMGFLEARKGRYGGFVDLLYLDVGGSSSQSRNVSIGGHPLPVGVTGNLDLDLKGTIVTLAGEYAAVTDPAMSLDILAGARVISLKETLNWQFSADLPAGTGPSRSGTSEEKADKWDGIVGVKGRMRFGPNREWFVPYYADIGTGQSDLTWQAIAGIGYSFKWGQVIAAWRYLDYKFKSDSAVERLDFNGPAIGVGFNW